MRFRPMIHFSRHAFADRNPWEAPFKDSILRQYTITHAKHGRIFCSHDIWCVTTKDVSTDESEIKTSFSLQIMECRNNELRNRFLKGWVCLWMNALHGTPPPPIDNNHLFHFYTKLFALSVSLYLFLGICSFPCVLFSGYIGLVSEEPAR